MPTILITGCPSGFGLETARHVLSQGWEVIATMRRSEPALLPASDRLRVLALDVTDTASIAEAVSKAGEVDVLANNAGIGWLNAVERKPMPVLRDPFETNTFGTVAMIQALIPLFRTRGAGSIVNATSSVTLRACDFLSAHNASKAAVNALTEVMAGELVPFAIRAHVVLPGRAPGREFTAQARARLLQEGGFPWTYAETIRAALTRLNAGDGPKTQAQDVVQAIWRAATDASGADAEAAFAAVRSRS